MNKRTSKIPFSKRVNQFFSQEYEEGNIPPTLTMENTEEIFEKAPRLKKEGKLQHPKSAFPKKRNYFKGKKFFKFEA